MHRGDRERFSAQMTSRGGISDCATDCMVGSRLELEAGGATPPASLPGITPLGELPCFPICLCEEFDTAHVSDVAEEELVAGAGTSGCFTFVMRPVLRMLAALAMLGGADASRHDNEVATCQWLVPSVTIVVTIMLAAIMVVVRSRWWRFGGLDAPNTGSRVTEFYSSGLSGRVWLRCGLRQRVAMALLVLPVAEAAGQGVVTPWELLVAGGMYGILRPGRIPNDVAQAEVEEGFVDAEGELREEEVPNALSESSAEESGDEGTADGLDQTAGIDQDLDPAVQFADTALGAPINNGGFLTSETEWAGHAFEQRTRGQGIVLFSGNVRRMPTGAKAHEQDALWKAFATRGADFVAIQDHGLELNDRLAKGQYCPHYTAGKTLMRAERWGRRGMRWIVAPGMAGGRGGQMRKVLEGGTLLACTEQWRSRAGRYVHDSRGWGRFCATVIAGGRRWHRQLVLVSCYCPAQGSATWRRQKRMLDALRRTEQGIEADPRSQFYRDLHDSLMPFVASATMESAYVMMGDFNERWQDDYVPNTLFDGVVTFAKMMHLDNAMLAVHGGGHRQHRYWTRTEGQSKSCPDFMLVSRVLLCSGTVKVGVWQGVAPLASDHRLMAMEIDCSKFLGVTARRMRLPKLTFKSRPPNLYLNDKVKMYQYQGVVCELYEERGIANKVEQLELMIAAREQSAIPFGTADSAIQWAITDLETALLSLMVDARCRVVGKPFIYGKRHRTKNKGPASQAQKKVGREIQDVDRLLHLVLVNKGAAVQKALQMAKRHDVQWMGRPCLTLWKRRDWADLQERIQQRRRSLRAQYNASWRESQRIACQKNRAWVKACHQQRKVRELITRIEKKRPQAIDRDTLVVGDGDSARYLDTAGEIGQALHDFFSQWFREGVDSWFQQWENGVVVYTHPLFRNDDEGWAARKRLVEGLSADEEDPDFQRWLQEVAFEGVPTQCRWVLMLYGRKFSTVLNRRVTQADYAARGVMQPVSEGSYIQYWNKKAANKACDYYDVNANLIKALAKTVEWHDEGGYSHSAVLTYHVFEVGRFLINVVIRTGLCSDTWLDEILLTIPKVEGSNRLLDVRPIGIIAVFRNAFFGIQYSGVKDTWEDLRLVAMTQYGAQRGIGTMEFRLQQMTVFEHCYIYDEEVGGGNEDKEKAYCRPSVTAGYCMGMLRLAVCDKLLWFELKIVKTSRIRVRFAYGFSPVVSKTNLGSCGFGAAQGSEEGPDRYVAFEDVINTWWEHAEMGVLVQVSEYKWVWFKGGGFVDDKKPLGRAEDLVMWYPKSAEFCMFHGAGVVPRKCAVHVKRLGKDRRIARAASLPRIQIVLTPGGEPVDIKVVEADESLKTLGELTNPSLYWKPLLRELRIKAEQEALIFRSGVDRASAKLHWEVSFEPSVIYKALFGEITEPQFYEALRPAWSAYKSKLGLSRSTPTLAAQAFGIGDTWSILMVDRLMSLLRALCSDKPHVNEAALAMLHLEQKWEGSGMPCLHRGHCAHRGRSGTWVGDLRVWMRSVGIYVEGGKGLMPLRSGDFCIVDEVDESEKGVVSAGLWCIEVWRVSEFFTGSGELRLNWLSGIWEEGMLTDIDDATAESKRDATDRCIAAVNRVLMDYKLGTQLGPWLREAVRVDSYVLIRDSETSFRLGRVLSMAQDMTWEDSVELRLMGRHELSDEITGVYGRRWQEFKDDQIWVDHQGCCNKRVAARRCMPVWMMELHWGEGEKDYGYMIDEQEETLLGWMEGEMLPHQWSTAKGDEEQSGDEWWFEGLEEMIGWSDESLVAELWPEYLNRFEVAELHAMVLLLYSDGSHLPAGIESRGSYGYQVWGFEGEEEMCSESGDRVTGGCIVHGDPLLLDSTRCEHAGGLGALIAACRLGWVGKVKLTMDNSGVTARMADKSSRGARWRDERMAERPLQWLKLNDPDIHAEAAAWCKRFESVQWMWHPGHPENRKCVAMYDQHDRASVLCDAVAAQQYTRYGTSDLRLDWWKFNHAPEYKVFWHGQVIQGNIRKQLLRKLREVRLMQYVSTNMAIRDQAKRVEERQSSGAVLEGTKAAELRDLRSQKFSDLEASWFLPGLMSDMLNKGGGAGDTVIAIKVLAGILATEGSAAHRGKGGSCVQCRLCGKSEEGGETNFHVLWQCKANQSVVNARNELADRVWAVIDKYGVADSDKLIAGALVLLKEGQAVWTEAMQLMELMADLPVEARHVRHAVTAAEGLEGRALDWGRKGSLGADWVKALMEMGVPRGRAFESVKGMNTELRRGSATIWRAFAAAVHGAEEATVAAEDIKTDALIEEIFDAEENGELISIGRMVGSWPMSKRRKWVTQYLYLEPQVGRTQAILRAQALAKKPALARRAKLSEVWGEAMSAACKKRRRERRQDDEQEQRMPAEYTLLMNNDFRRYTQRQGENDGEAERGSGRLRVTRKAISKRKTKLPEKNPPRATRTLERVSGDSDASGDADHQQGEDVRGVSAPTGRENELGASDVPTRQRGENGSGGAPPSGRENVSGRLKRPNAAIYVLDHSCASPSVHASTPGGPRQDESTPEQTGSREMANSAPDRQRQSLGARDVVGETGDTSGVGGGDDEECAPPGAAQNASEDVLRETPDAVRGRVGLDSRTAERRQAAQPSQEAARFSRTRERLGGADAGEIGVGAQQSGEFGGGDEFDEGGRTSAEDSAGEEDSARVVRGRRRRNRKRRRAIDISSSGSGSVAELEEWIPRGRREKSDVGSDRDSDDAGQGGGRCRQKPHARGLGGASSEGARNRATVQTPGPTGVITRPNQEAEGIPGFGSSDPVVQEVGRGTWAVLPGVGSERMGLLTAGSGMGAESSRGLHRDAADRALGYRSEGSAEGDRMAGLHRDGEAVDLAPLPHILRDECDQSGSRMLLQGRGRSDKATDSRVVVVRDGGYQIGQSGETQFDNNRSVCDPVQGEVGAGEPQGVPVSEAIHDRNATAAQSDSGGLLRFQRALHETYPPLDQLELYAPGDDRVPAREVLPSLREGSHGGLRQVEPCERDRSVQPASSVWDRAQGSEGGSAPYVTRGADAERQHGLRQHDDLAFLKAPKRGLKRKRKEISTRKRKVEELEPDVPPYALEVELESRSNASGGSGESGRVKDSNWRTSLHDP